MHVSRGVAVRDHAVVIAGGGPTGLMLAGELALAGVDVVIVERRASQELIGSRAGGLHSRTIEIFDQRGIADRLGLDTRCSDAACPISIWLPPTARFGSSPCCTMPGRCCSTSVSPAASTSLHGQSGFGQSTPHTLVYGSFRHSGWSLPPPPC
jgi:hypothetical protein